MHIRELPRDIGVEKAKQVFDFQEQGKADMAVGVAMAYAPAIDAACNHAMTRITDIALELGLSQDQTIELYRMYTLGVATTALIVMRSDEL
jgi:hypothetical protein